MRRKRRSGTSLVLLLSACVFAAGAEKKKAAPQSYALVAGTVFQSRGFALPNAEITLIPDFQAGSAPVKAKKLQAISDGRGEFTFRVPPVPGQYLLKVTAEGFHPGEKPVSVQGEERVDVTFQLEPESK